jgi:hypothetical protein
VKIRVLFKSPFSYTFGNERFYVSTGQSKYLDSQITRDKKELEYLFSPNFPYSSWIHIEQKDIEQFNKENNSSVVLVDNLLTADSVIYQFEEEDIDELNASTKVVEPVVEVTESKIEVEDRGVRKAELDEWHYKKLDALLKSYKLGEYSDYQDKDRVIEAILELEFA